MLSDTASGRRTIVSCQFRNAYDAVAAVPADFAGQVSVS